MLMVSYSKTLFFTTTGFFLLNLFLFTPGKECWPLFGLSDRSGLRENQNYIPSPCTFWNCTVATISCLPGNRLHSWGFPSSSSISSLSCSYGLSSSLSLWNQMNRNCRERSLGCQAGDSWARNKDFKAAGPTVILAGPMLGPSQKTDFRRGKGWGFDPLPWRMAKERSRKLEPELGPRLMLVKIDNK